MRHLVRDAARDAWFASQGCRVLRFWNGQMPHEYQSVLDTIYAAIDPDR
jgi:very-short-patch-repair endonuclease